MSKFLKEEVRAFHDTGQIVHIDADELIMSGAILHLDIWAGLAGIESSAGLSNIHMRLI
jgi:hypothetical protein